MCDMQKMPSREDASCEEDSEMNFATFSAVGAPGTHFVTTGGQLPVTKIQQNVSNNGTGMQQVCVAMGDGGVQYMRALDGGATIQAAPQLISVPIALPGAKPGDPQPTVQIQVLNPNLLQAQQQPKYQMQIPIQGFQQGGAVLTLAYSPENEAGGIQLVGQGSLGEGLQVLATLPHEMQLVQPTQEKDHMQNMHQVFITPNQQIIINGPENKTLNNNTSSDNNNESMEIIIKEECDETTNDDESSQGTETSDSIQWQLGTSHQQDLVKYLNTLPPQQTQALPASLQQFLRKNPTDVKSEPVEIDIDMDDVVTDDKKEEPVAEAVLSEGLYLESSSEQQRSELDLQDYVKILNEESNDTFESLKDNFPKMKGPASKADKSVKKDVPIVGMQSKKFSIAEISHRTIDQSLSKVDPVKNEPFKLPTEVFPVLRKPRSNKRKKIRSVSQSDSEPIEIIDLVSDDYPETNSIPKAVKTLQNVKPPMNTKQQAIEPVIQFIPVFNKSPLKFLPVLISTASKSISQKSQPSTRLQYIAYTSVKPLAQVRPMIKKSPSPSKDTSVKVRTVESPINSPPALKRPRYQTKVNQVSSNTSNVSLPLDDSSKINNTHASPLNYKSSNTAKQSPNADQPVTDKLRKASKYNLISYPSNHIIEPPKGPRLVSRPKKLAEKPTETFSESLSIAKSQFEKSKIIKETLPSYQKSDTTSDILPIRSKTPSNPTGHNSVNNKSSPRIKQTPTVLENNQSFQIIEPLSTEFSMVSQNSFSATGTIPLVTYPEPLSATNNLFQQDKADSDEYPCETINLVTNETLEQSGNNVETFPSYQSIETLSEELSVKQANVSSQSLPLSDNFQLTTDALNNIQGGTDIYTFKTLEPHLTFAIENDSLQQTTATFQPFEVIKPISGAKDSVVQDETPTETYPSYKATDKLPDVVSVVNEPYETLDNNQLSQQTYQNMEFQIIGPSSDAAIANETYEFTEIPPDVYEAEYGSGDVNDSYNPTDNTTITNDPSNYQSYNNVEQFTEIPPEVTETIDLTADSPIGDVIFGSTYDATDGPPGSGQSYQNLGTLPETLQQSTISPALATTYPTFEIIEQVESTEPLVVDQQVNYTTYENYEPQTNVSSGNYAQYENTNNERSSEMIISAEVVQPGNSLQECQKICETTQQITDDQTQNYKEFEVVVVPEENSSKYQQYDTVQQLTDLQTKNKQPYDTGQLSKALQGNTIQPDEQICIKQPSRFEPLQAIQNLTEFQSPNSVRMTEETLATNQFYETVEQLSEQYETDPNITEQSVTDREYEADPQLVAQPLATNQLYETVEQTTVQYKTVIISPEQSSTEQQCGMSTQLVAQPLSTNQFYETVEQITEQYETVIVSPEQSSADQQCGMSTQLFAQPLTTNQIYETVEQITKQYETVIVSPEQSSTEKQCGMSTQLVAQPLTTNQLYETVEQITEQYQTVIVSPEQSSTEQQCGMSTQLVAQPLTTNQLYETVEEITEQYETVIISPEQSNTEQKCEMNTQLVAQPLATNQLYEPAEHLQGQYAVDPISTEQSVTDLQCETVTQLMSQPLARNQLYETVKQLAEQYETVQNTPEISITDQQYDTGTQLVAQPLAVNQLYETVEQLQGEYEPDQNTPVQSVTEQQYETSQLVAQPLAINQLYESVDQLAENVQHLSEPPLPTNEAYESAQQFIELQPTTNQHYEAMINQITEQLAMNQLYETFQQVVNSNTNQFYETIESRQEYEAASNQPYVIIEPSVHAQTTDPNLNSPTFPLNDLLPLAYPSYELIEPLKPLTDVSLGTYTSQDVVETVTETTDPPTHQSFGPLTEVFAVHYPQYENIASWSEIYPLYEATGVSTYDTPVTDEVYKEFPPLEDVKLPIGYQENFGTVERVTDYQFNTDPSYNGGNYFTEIPPPPNDSKEESGTLWANPLPSDHMNRNSLNEGTFIYQNNETGVECFSNTAAAYGAVESVSDVPFEIAKPLVKVSNVTNASCDGVESQIEVASIIETPFVQPEVAPPYQTINIQAEIIPILSPAYVGVEPLNAILVSNSDQQVDPQVTNILLVAYELSEAEQEIALDINKKPQNAKTECQVSKAKADNKEANIKGKASKPKKERKSLKPKKESKPLTTTKESKPYVYKPRQRKITKKIKTVIQKTPHVETIKATPTTPCTKLVPKVEPPDSEYDIQRVKTVYETLQSEAECVNKKKWEKAVLRSEDGTFQAFLSEEERLRHERNRRRLGEKYKRLYKSVQLVTGVTRFNYKGVVVPDKSLKIGTCSCPLKCYLKIDPTQQQKVFNEFHTLTTFKQQEEYILSLIKIFRKGNAYMTENTKRKHTLRYHITGSQGQEIIVCKMFFKKTLVISDGRISRVLKRNPFDEERLAFPHDDQGVDKEQIESQ